MTTFDVETIKADNPIAAYLERAGIVLRPSAGGKKLTGCCPIHHGDNQSAFHVDTEKGVWFCFTGCQKGGDVIDLDVALRGGTFADSCQRLGGQAQSTASTSRPAQKPKPPPQDDPVLSKQDREFAAKTAERLAKDPKLIRRLAEARSWRPETLRRLALECSLGWHEGKLLFITERGIKARWRRNGKRRFEFLRGKAGLWRRHEWELRTLPHHRPERIVLTEGETDAVTLIDAGAELDGKTIVCALPSASGFKECWLPLFAGREVILSLDDDDAGRKAQRAIVEALRGVAASVREIRLEGRAA